MDAGEIWMAIEIQLIIMKHKTDKDRKLLRRIFNRIFLWWSHVVLGYVCGNIALYIDICILNIDYIILRKVPSITSQFKGKHGHFDHHHHHHRPTDISSDLTIHRRFLFVLFTCCFFMCYGLYVHALLYYIDNLFLIVLDGLEDNLCLYVGAQYHECPIYLV